MATAEKTTKDTKVITQDRPVPTARVGSADIVGFGIYGTIILRHGNPQPVIAVKDFGLNAGGWRTDRHVRLVGDITGNGKCDIVGFGDAGVLASINDGKDIFTNPPKVVLAEFGYDGGWRVDKHIRYLADTQDSGRCDIVGFGNDGVHISRNTRSATFDSSYVAIADFGCDPAAGGWTLERHLRFLGDTTGNGRPDIVAFGQETVLTSINKGDGTFEPAQTVIHGLCYSSGWRVDKHPRFIADLTGDGKVDVIGCGNEGLHVSLNKGNSSFGPIKIVLREFGVAQGWDLSKHPRCVADLTGNKQGDFIGFGEGGVWVARGNGDGTFREASLVLNHFGVKQGWEVSKHPRFVVDLTGDGCADIIGFGETHTYVSYNDGKGGFGAVRTLNKEFAYNNGEWTVGNTVRWPANL